MTPPFSVGATPHYDRLARRLIAQHPEFDALENRARQILETDPTNRMRQHHIKKLEAVAVGDGQWRLSLGRFRFRYDIYSSEVMLQHCGFRPETTYR